MAAATATTEEHINIEDIGPCRKRITIALPAEAVTEQIGQSLDLVAAEATLPGFRAGRVPRKLVEKKFGAAVRNEAKSQLLSSAYSRAVEENKLRVIGEPERIDDDNETDIEAGQAITFTVEIDVAPDFELPAFSEIEVLKPTYEVTTEQVDEQLERACRNEGELEPHDKAEAGDYCIGDGKLMVKGEDEPVYDLKGAVIQIPDKADDGKGRILGVVIDDFEKQVGTPTAGDTITVKAKGPEHHEREKIRGADLTITFEVEQVQRILPATVDALVEKYGFADVEQLRQSVQEQLERRIQIEQASAMRSQAAEALLDQIDFDIPERLTENQAERRLERQRMEMEYRGEDAQTIEDAVADARSTSHEGAQRELKLFFMLAKAAEDMKVEVTEEEVGGRITQLAQDRNERPERLRAELIRTGRIQTLLQQIREHKTLDSIVAKALMKEVTTDEFKAAMESRADKK